MSLIYKDDKGNLVIQSIRYRNYRPEQCKIKCDYISCAAGMGQAGNGNCFLEGAFWMNSCPAFIDAGYERCEEKEWVVSN